MEAMINMSFKILLKSIIILASCCGLVNAYSMSHNDIKIAWSVAEIEKVLPTINQDTFIFIDVDRTLIMPVDKIFLFDNGQNKYLSFLDDWYKSEIQNPKNQQRKLQYTKAFSMWRKQRKVRILDENWFEFIAKAKQKGATVLAISNVQPGPFGVLPSTEDWRINDLAALGLTFSDLYNEQAIIIDTVPKIEGSPFPLLKKGVYCVGDYPKGKAIVGLLKKINKKVSTIICFDDRLKYVEEEQESIKNYNKNILFTAFHFRGAERVLGKPDPEVSEFQINYLLKNLKWLSDDEAVKELKQSKK